MSKVKLYFSHANSYPSGTYRRLFTLLGEHYDIQAADMYAHRPDYPVQVGWPHQVKELVDELKARYNEPVVLVGHSLGGMLSLMAAAKHPELVRCVLLLDSPVVAGWRALLVRLGRRLPGADRFTPARFSARRRTVWPSKQAAYEHFASKKVFSAWAPGVLQDYVDAGLAPDPQGVRLRFTREQETAVYRTLPHHVGRLVRRGMRVPVGFIGGTESVENRQAGLDATRRLVRHNMRMVPGGHLFPMEDPAMTAAAVHELLSSLLMEPLRLRRRRRW